MVAELAAILDSMFSMITKDPTSWCVLSDSRSALESLFCSRKKSTNSHIILKTRTAYQDAPLSGHVQLQWIPSHCGLYGNDIADKAASAGHEKTTLTLVPFTRADAASLVARIGKEVSALLWTNRQYHYKYLYNSYPT